jgi:hypothetical protein
MLRTSQSPPPPLTASDNGARLLAAGNGVNGLDCPPSSDHAWSTDDDDLVGIVGADYTAVFCDKALSQPVTDTPGSANSRYYLILVGSIWFQVSCASETRRR